MTPSQGGNYSLIVTMQRSPDRLFLSVPNQTQGRDSDEGMCNSNFGGNCVEAFRFSKSTLAERSS